MDGVSSVAAVLQVLGNAVSVALQTARFMNNVKNAEQFRSDFLQGLRLSENTIRLLTTQLKTSNFAQPYNQDIKEVDKLVHEIARDCRKCHSTLARLYNSPGNTIIRRFSGELRREIRRPEIESVNARIRSNVGNIQALLSVLQLIASDQQKTRNERIENRLEDIQAKLYPLPGLRNKLVASLNHLHDSGQDANRMRSSETISPTCIDIVLSRDTNVCIRITDGTLKTANSICAKVSPVGSIRNFSLSNGTPYLINNLSDTSKSHFGLYDGTSITLSTMTTFLETYIRESNEEFEKACYEKCKMYIQEALDWGEYRYMEYDVDFHQWFDLELRLAEVYEKEGNFQDARRFLVFLRQSSDSNNLDYRRISNLQEAQLRCATARLYLHEYEQGHSRSLDELKQQAFNAFGAADAIYRNTSISEGASASVDVPQKLLIGSASTLDKVYVIFGDTAGRKSLRKEHKILRETLPQLDSTARSARSAIPERRTRPSVLYMVALPKTSPPRRLSTSGSSDISPTSPAFPDTGNTRPSESADRDAANDLQSPGPVYRESEHAMDDRVMTIGDTECEKVSRLFEAAKSHNLKLLEPHFSDFLPHIEARDKAGMNILHHVLTTLGGENDIRMLILNGVDVNASDNYGETPLHYCVRRNNFQCAKLLLRTGKVVIESVNNSNQTPAQLALNQSGMYHMNMPKLLIEYKANFDWPGIPRHIHDSLRRLIQEITVNMRQQTWQGRRDSRASENSRSSQQSRWLRATGRNSFKSY